MYLFWVNRLYVTLVHIVPFRFFRPCIITMVCNYFFKNFFRYFGSYCALLFIRTVYNCRDFVIIFSYPKLHKYFSVLTQFFARTFQSSNTMWDFSNTIILSFGCTTIDFLYQLLELFQEYRDVHSMNNRPRPYPNVLKSFESQALLDGPRCYSLGARPSQLPRYYRSRLCSVKLSHISLSYIQLHQIKLGSMLDQSGDTGGNRVPLSIFRTFQRIPM